MSQDEFKKGLVVRILEAKKVGFLGEALDATDKISFSLKGLDFQPIVGMEVEYQVVESYDMVKNAPCDKAVNVRQPI